MKLMNSYNRLLLQISTGSRSKLFRMAMVSSFLIFGQIVQGSLHRYLQTQNLLFLTEIHFLRFVILYA